MDSLENVVSEIKLSHPLKTRAIAEARVKTDKVDSAILAHLLRTDLLPTAHIAPISVREERELLRIRVSLTGLRTAVKNNIHAILGQTRPATGIDRGSGAATSSRLGRFNPERCSCPYDPHLWRKRLVPKGSR